MNALLIVAGVLGLIGASVHGIVGEVLVVKRLGIGTLPPSRFGSPRTTKAMIHTTWHMTTIAFVTVGCGLVLAGSVLHGGSRQAVGEVAASAATGFAAIAIALGAGYAKSPRALFRHPAPAVLTATAVVAWLGAL